MKRKLTGRWYVKNYLLFHIIEVEHEIADTSTTDATTKIVWSKATKQDLIELKLIVPNG